MRHDFERHCKSQSNGPETLMNSLGSPSMLNSEFNSAKVQQVLTRCILNSGGTLTVTGWTAFTSWYSRGLGVFNKGVCVCMSWSQLGNGVAKTCNWRELVFTLPHIVLWEIFTTSWTHVCPSLSLCTRYPLIHTPVPKRQVEDKFELTWILTLYIYINEPSPLDPLVCFNHHLESLGGRQLSCTTFWRSSHCDSPRPQLAGSAGKCFNHLPTELDCIGFRLLDRTSQTSPRQ